MSFEPDTTVGRVKELAWNAWPSGECRLRSFLGFFLLCRVTCRLLCASLEGLYCLHFWRLFRSSLLIDSRLPVFDRMAR